MTVAIHGNYKIIEVVANCNQNQWFNLDRNIDKPASTEIMGIGAIPYGHSAQEVQVTRQTTNNGPMFFAEIVIAQEPERALLCPCLGNVPRRAFLVIYFT